MHSSSKWIYHCVDSYYFPLRVFTTDIFHPHESLNNRPLTSIATYLHFVVGKWIDLKNPIVSWCFSLTDSAMDSTLLTCEEFTADSFPRETPWAFSRLLTTMLFTQSSTSSLKSFPLWFHSISRWRVSQNLLLSADISPRRGSPAF